MKKVLILIILVIAGLLIYKYWPRQIKKNSALPKLPSVMQTQPPAEETQNIKADVVAPAATSTPPINTVPYAVGFAERHPQTTLNQTVLMQGYMLKQENGYAYFSDEKTGPVGPGDLPVIGAQVANLVFGHLYTLEGKLVHGLVGSNGNKYHFELDDIIKTK